MTRFLTALGFAAALTMSAALVAPHSFEAEAAKKPKNKQCMATNSAGKKVSFKCGGEEKCCWNVITQKGTCLPANGICL